ncbi:MAG: TRAP transporter small permease [Alphaproteobacteria bacterium]|nr:TRAP transporter small permease [Alphaproteobacteria bacterium]
MFRSIRRGIVWIEESIMAYMLATMTAVAFFAVIVRRFFGGEVFGLKPSIWGLELTLYIFLFFILFGMSYVLRKGVHIGIDVLVNLFPAPIRKAFNIVATLLTVLYALLLSRAGYQAFEKFWSVKVLRNKGSDELEIPFFFTYGFLSLAFFVLAMTAAFAIWEIWTDRRESLTAGHEAEEEVDQVVASANAAASMSTSTPADQSRDHQDHQDHKDERDAPSSKTSEARR